MKKVNDQQAAADRRAQLSEHHTRAQEAAKNAQAHALKSEKQNEQADKHINKERRSFLDMIGKAGVSTSVLKASSLAGGLFASRHAMAAGGPKRVIYCYLDSGADNASWLPSSASNMNVVTQPYGPNGHNVASVCHFRQVDVLMSGHSMAAQALGVTAYGVPTMDTRIAPILSANTPYSALYLGSEATTSGNLCSTIGPCIDDPASAYNRYFDSAPPAGSTDETYLKVFEAQNRALLSIRQKLGQDERERLDAHGDALERIEKQITAQMSGEGPDLDAYRPTLPSAQTYSGRIVSRGKVQVDIMLAALKAGLTNVGVLQLGNHQGTWVGDGTRFNDTLHSAAHNNPSDATNFNEMIRHLSEVPAYCIRRMMDEEDSDGQKLIDTTVFVQVTCMGNGMTHEPDLAPFIVATRMPGFTSGFSASSAGDTRDLNGAIPRGLGISESMYAPMGSSTLGLV